MLFVPSRNLCASASLRPGGVSELDLVSERLELAADVLLDCQLFDAAEKFESRRNVPGLTPDFAIK